MIKKTKVKVYIDGANMFFTQKKLGWLFDWEKIGKYLIKEYSVQEIRFYVGQKEKDEKMERFLKALKEIGFKVFTKPVKIIKSESGIEEKANFDVEITRDILLDFLFYKKKWQGLVFLSGDSDFAPLFWDLKKIFKKQIFVFSSRITLSWELRLAATKFCYLEDIKSEVFRRSWNLTKTTKNVKVKSLNRRSR